MKWSFGDRLVRARKRAGFRTQADLGDEIGASRNTVAQWERDETLPEGRLMIQLPETLGVSADWLFYGIEPGERSAAFDEIAAIVDRLRSPEGVVATKAGAAGASVRAADEQRRAQRREAEQGGRNGPGGEGSSEAANDGGAS